MSLSILGLVLIAFGLYLFRDSQGLRSLFADRRMDESPSPFQLDARIVRPIASVGEGQIPLDTLNGSIHRASWGLRLLTTGLSVYLIHIAWPQMIQNPHLHGPDTSLTSLGWGLGAILLYTNVYIWSYRVSQDGRVLWNMGQLFTSRHYDLGQLASVTHHGMYQYRLKFTDGQVADIQKYVAGGKQLRQVLQHYVDRNQGA